MKFFAIFIVFASVLTLSAKTVPFRSGEILAAEYSSSKPTVINWNKHLFVNNSASNYVAVAVRMHPKRKISIYDYAFFVNGRNYSCVAIRTNGGNFTYIQNALGGSKDEIFTLLFFVNESVSSENTVALISQLPPRKYDPAEFKMTEADGVLLPFKSIKKDGNF